MSHVIADALIFLPVMLACYVVLASMFYAYLKGISEFDLYGFMAEDVSCEVQRAIVRAQVARFRYIQARDHSFALLGEQIEARKEALEQVQKLKYSYRWARREPDYGM